MPAPIHEIEMVEVASVHVGRRHRTPTAQKVAQLVESIGQIGLQCPILVRFVDEMEINGEIVANWPILVAGASRLAAVKQLGWEYVEAVDIKGDELDAELIEIDENLCRAELTEAEEAEHLKRRKELWEAREKRKAKTGGTTCPTSLIDGRAAGPQHAKGFAAETAAITGESKRAINRKISRAEKIAPDVLEEITGSDLDKGVVLDVLKRLDHDEQRQAVDRVQSGVSPTVNDAFEFIRGEPPKRTRGRPPKAESIQEPMVIPDYPEPLADSVPDRHACEQWLAEGDAWWARGRNEWQEQFLARINKSLVDKTGRAA